MPKEKGIIFFGITEILIGGISFCAVITSLALEVSTKPLNVLLFVIATSCVSSYLGIGILRYNKQAYELLLFLAGVIALSKLLIFTKIISLNGALETKIPADFKNIISIIYHLGLIFYFRQGSIKEKFKR